MGCRSPVTVVSFLPPVKSSPQTIYSRNSSSTIWNSWRRNQNICSTIALVTGKMSFPDFSRRFSVSLAISIDTFGEVLLKGFTRSWWTSRIPAFCLARMDALDGAFILTIIFRVDGLSYHPDFSFGMAKVFHYFHLYIPFSCRFYFSTSFSVVRFPYVPMLALYIRYSCAVSCCCRSVCTFLLHSLHVPGCWTFL